MNSRGGKHGRCSPQTLRKLTTTTNKPTRRKKPLSDHNSALTSSDGPPPKGCFRFLVSNSSSKSSPHHTAPNPLRGSPPSSSQARYRSVAPPLGDGTLNNLLLPTGNGTHPTTSNCVVSTAGRVNEQGMPPIQASISPEIHCGSEIGKDGSACFAAGHIVSKVKDRRKCRPRGILTVGEKDVNIQSRGASVFPMPAEASVRWLASPNGGLKGIPRNRSFESGICSSRTESELGFHDKFAKFEQGFGSRIVGDHCTDCEADFRNGSSASPRNEARLRNIFDSKTAENPVNVVGDYASDQIKVGIYKESGHSAGIAQSCILDCGFVETPKTSSFAFHNDELRVGRNFDVTERHCSYNEKLSCRDAGCDAEERPKDGSFAFAGFDCSLRSEIELGLQYNWNSPSSRLTAKDGILGGESSSEITAQLNHSKTECLHAAGDYDERLKNGSFARFNCTPSGKGSDSGLQHKWNSLSSSFRSIDEILERELCSEISVRSDHSKTESIQLLSEGSHSYGCCPESAPVHCRFDPSSEDSSSLKSTLPSDSHGSGMVSNCNRHRQNHSDSQNSLLKFHRELYELQASPMALETPFSELKKSSCSLCRSESASRSNPRDHGVTNSNSSILNIANWQKSSSDSLESPSSESKTLLLCLDRLKLDGNNVAKNLNSSRKSITKFDDGNCKAGSVALQETACSGSKKPASCLDASELPAVSSPISSGSSWNQNAIQTPSPYAEHRSFEFNSMDEVLQTLRSTPDRSAFLPLPGFDFQFYYPATPYHAARGTCIGDPLYNQDASKSTPKVEHGNELSSPTFDNILHMRVSWRDGLISRIFEMEETDISERREEAEEEVHLEECQKSSVGFDVDPNPNLGSPVLDDEKSLQLSGGFRSLEMVNTPQDGAAKDSDWRVCYRNHLFEETA